VAVAAFATTAIAQGGVAQLSFNFDLEGATGTTPFFLVNGECDAKNFDTALDTNGNSVTILDGTLDIISGNGANDQVYFASLSDLDHFSIQDRLGDSADFNNECDSPLDRELQVEASVEALTYWIEKQIKGRIRNICEDMLVDSNLGAMGFELVRCIPDS
jgi:hypothetical protein